MIRQFGGELKNLALEVPWVPRVMPELMPWHSPPTSPLAGLSNEILPLCPKVKTLRLHDPLLQFVELTHLHDLRDLYVSMQSWTEFTTDIEKHHLPSVRHLEINIPDTELGPDWVSRCEWADKYKLLHGTTFWVDERFMPNVFVFVRTREILARLPESGFYEGTA